MANSLGVQATHINHTPRSPASQKHTHLLPEARGKKSIYCLTWPTFRVREKLVIKLSKQGQKAGKTGNTGKARKAGNAGVGFSRTKKIKMLDIHKFLPASPFLCINRFYFYAWRSLFLPFFPFYSGNSINLSQLPWGSANRTCGIRGV